MGSVREKNAKNIILKILLDACFAAIAFYTVGYAFAWGESCDTEDEKCKENKTCNCTVSNPFIGHKYFALINFPRGDSLGWISWFFQYAVIY